MFHDLEGDQGTRKQNQDGKHNEKMPGHKALLEGRLLDLVIFF